jgi:hypothetical protein
MSCKKNTFGGLNPGMQKWSTKNTIFQALKSWIDLSVRLEASSGA